MNSTGKSWKYHWKSHWKSNEIAFEITKNSNEIPIENCAGANEKLMITAALLVMKMQGSYERGNETCMYLKEWKGNEIHSLSRPVS